VPFDDAQAPDVPSELFSKFAGTDRDRSRNVGDPAKSIYRVAITMPDFGGVKVWGDFNPRKHEFVPVEIDALTLDDWSKRTITGDGFTEGALIPKPGEKAKAAVTGEWVVVKVGTASEHQSTERRYVWLKGTKHWGSYMARTLGPKGTASLLGNIVDELGSKHTSKRMPARISMG
jgi:hypothetical protein